MALSETALAEPLEVEGVYLFLGKGEKRPFGKCMVWRVKLLSPFKKMNICIDKSRYESSILPYQSLGSIEEFDEEVSSGPVEELWPRLFKRLTRAGGELNPSKSGLVVDPEPFSKGAIIRVLEDMIRSIYCEGNYFAGLMRCLMKDYSSERVLSSLISLFKSTVTINITRFNGEVHKEDFVKDGKGLYHPSTYDVNLSKKYINKDMGIEEGRFQSYKKSIDKHGKECVEVPMFRWVVSIYKPRTNYKESPTAMPDSVKRRIMELYSLTMSTKSAKPVSFHFINMFIDYVNKSEVVPLLSQSTTCVCLCYWDYSIGIDPSPQDLDGAVQFAVPV